LFATLLACWIIFARITWWMSLVLLTTFFTSRFI
jgi:hypothetical protein